MTTTLHGFNAAFDPWIPVVGPSGPTRLSISDALTQGPHFKGLATDRPLAVLPIIRLLAAVVLRVFEPQSADDIRRLWVAREFEADRIRHYLEIYRDRFDLFGEHPFLQVAGLMPASGEPKGASGLLLHIAGGNNVPMFSAFTDGDEIALSPPDALIEMLTVLGWDTAAIKTGAQGDPKMAGGKTTGNPTGPLGQLGAAIPLGTSLFETILLNVPPTPAVPGDGPTWESDLEPSWEIRQPVGIMEWLTWSSRRIRLARDERSGDVTGAVVTAGDRVLFTPLLDPHTRWRATKGDVVAQRPRRWPNGTPAWRGLDTLLILGRAEAGDTEDLAAPPHLIREVGELRALLGDTYPLNLLCLGVTYGNQSAVVEDVFVDSLPLPMTALRTDESSDVAEALREVSSGAEKVRRALNGLADNLRVAVGADKLPWDAGAHPGNDAMALLTAPTLRFLAGLQRQPELFNEGLRAWQEVAERVAWATAQPLLELAAPASFRGRDVKIGSSERRIRLADAEAWFRKGLRDALPYLFQIRDERNTP